MDRRSFYIINSLTIYRLGAAFILLALILMGEEQVFKWLLPISFFTDAIDGTLARRFHVESRWGSMIDSIADDLTILMAVIAAFRFKPEFIENQILPILILVGLYLVQTGLAIARYGKITSFHTYAAKIAAVFQGLFLVLLFILPEPPIVLFYFLLITTVIDLVEEIILVIVLPNWQRNVKGLYWVLKKKQERQT
jgi:phosphatidylglycerophosphate synthase